MITPNKMKKIFYLTVLFFLVSCSSISIFDGNKFYYKSGYQRVQLDSEDKQIKNIHPVNIDPNSIEGT